MASRLSSEQGAVPASPDAGRRGVWSWMLFDWAAQPFHTLIVTFIFAPYFAAHVAPNPTEGQALWGLAAGVGGLLIAVLSPILGAISDAAGPRKPWVAGFSVLAVLGVAALWFVAPGGEPQAITIALVAFVVALIGFEFSSVFTNAMMPSLVDRSRLGALSGNAWALGYLGGLVVLFVMLLTMVADPATGVTIIGVTPIFGLDPDRLEGDRAAGPLSALWYVVFVIPLFLFTPDARGALGLGHAIGAGLKRLKSTLTTIRSERSLVSFLLSSMFYRDALNGIYTFGGIYAVGVLGWTSVQLGVFGILALVAGIAGCVLAGALDTRIGTKAVVASAIVALTVGVILIASTAANEVLFMTVAQGSGAPTLMFYAAGALVGAAGGALQAASRPLLVDQAHPDQMGEAFGLYALSGKATAFLAPWAIGITTLAFDSQRVGILPLLVLLALGLVLLIPVRTGRSQSSHE